MNDPWKERLSEHLDGELSPGDARELEVHLQNCLECREALADLRRIVETARALPDQEPARELWPAIEAQLDPVATTHPARRSPWKVPFVVAATVVIALGAIWLSRKDEAGPPRTPKLARYLMLLHEPADHGASATSEEIASVVDEYRTWARGIAQSGHLVSGEKLADDAGWILRSDEEDLPAAGRGSSDVGGFFIIAAASDREAREIARGCPHLAHDGWIELRPIEDTDAPRPRNER